MRFFKNRRGTAEIIGTTFFLVILFVVLANNLWYNQVSIETNTHLSQKANSHVMLETATDGLTLNVTSLGSYDVELKGLWMIEANTDDHEYVTEETLETLVVDSLIIPVGNYTEIDISTYAISFTGPVTYKVLTDLGNMATTSYDYTPSYYKPISLPGMVGSSPHYNFPVLVSVQADTDIGDRITGSDEVYFTADDGTTLLSHEFDSFSTFGGASFDAWVKIPILTPSTVIRVYYGETRPEINDPTDVWSEGYAAVYHMGESATDGGSIVGLYKDSTDNGNDGDQHGTSIYTMGMIGGAQSFLIGDGDFIDLGNDASLSITGNQLTLSVWVRPTQNGDGAYSRIISKGNGAGSDVYALMQDSGNQIIVRLDQIDHYSGVNYDLIDWNYVVATYDGSDRIIYKNGAQAGSEVPKSDNVDDSTVQVVLGNLFGEARWFVGQMDEIRVSSVGRSTNWVKTEYNNMNNPGYISGPEEV